MKDKTNIYYWSPFISNVATVNAVLGSIKTLKTYSNQKYVPHIINAAGEWNKYYKELNECGVNIIELTKSKIIDNSNYTGFLKSRLIYLYLFFILFIPLLRLLKKKPPDYLIIHLITPLPLLLNYFFNINTKVILRISGLPKLNSIRKFFWKKTLRKIYHITCPTKSTTSFIQKLDMVSSKKISTLYDPIISTKVINEKKRKKLNFQFDNFYLAIGRFTKQKNFKFLIEVFSDFLKTNNDNLIIIGEGEERNSLLKFIEKKNLKNRIYLIGYQENVFKYFEKSKCFILSSLWEDPGFVLVESAYMNIPIISSDCNNGPKEILADGKNGILFKSNDKESLQNALLNFEKMDKKIIKQKLINCKKGIKVFTYFNHFKSLEKIFYAS
tara:strand:+ start:17727 stop:18878 length:1152 start_codon:yes stop_codon:yes gene_type:complete